MELTCHRCGNTWNYKPRDPVKKRTYAVCSCCFTRVKTPFYFELKERIEREKQKEREIE